MTKFIRMESLSIAIRLIKCNTHKRLLYSATHRFTITSHSFRITGLVHKKQAHSILCIFNRLNTSSAGLRSFAPSLTKLLPRPLGSCGSGVRVQIGGQWLVGGDSKGWPSLRLALIQGLGQLQCPSKSWMATWRAVYNLKYMDQGGGFITGLIW